MKIGIFELGSSANNANDLEIIENTIEFAKLSDQLGYSRFWISEHHEFGVAWRSPEILMAILAGYTDKIKIGAAGMLLALNSPMRIAQNFKMLSSLFEGRIDLGIARGVSSEYIAKELLNGLDFKILLKEHLNRTQDVLKYFRNDIIHFNDDKKHSFCNVPFNGSNPDIWILGSSGITSDFAVKEKLNFSLSLLHVDKEKYNSSKETFHSFLQKYNIENNETPVTNIAISIVCGKNKKECDNILNSHQNNFTINIIGDIEECYDKISMISEDFKTNEIVIHLVNNNFNDKSEVIQQLASKFKL